MVKGQIVIVGRPSVRDLTTVLMEMEAMEINTTGENSAAQAGKKAGENFLAMMKEKESPKVFTFEQIEATEKVTLRSGKEVVLFTFGHNYGPALQPNFRSLTKLECVELWDIRRGLPGLPMFISDTVDQYFLYNTDDQSFTHVDPNKSLTEVFNVKIENEMFKSNLPFWHHYISYLPQIKLVG